MSARSTARRRIALAMALAMSFVFGAAASATADPPPVAPSGAAERQQLYLNGDAWQFRPIKMPFFGWELQDTPIDRSFIRDAIEAVPEREWETWHDVRVPMAWNSYEEFDFPDYWHYVHRGEYRRTFDVPASFAGERISLHFEGVNWKAWVYVNDTLVHAEGFEEEDFTHEFALTPFDVDITDAVAPGSRGNELRVVVQDITANMIGPAPAEYSVLKYPMGVRGEYWNQNYASSPRGYHELKSGIFKDVTLVAAPPTYVEDVFVRPDLQNDRVTAEVTVRNAGDEARTVTVDSGVVTWPDGASALTFEDRPTVTVPAGGRTKVTVTQPWDDYDLWWPDDPTLYTMVTRLHPGRGRPVIDEVTNRFGMREVKAVASDDVHERGVYVNGVRTALFGESVETNIQGMGVDSLNEDGLTFNGNWALTRSYFSQVIDVAKSMNINVLRIHRGWGLTKELVEIADEKGMMLIAENPVTIPAWEYPLTEEHRTSGVEMVLQIAKHYRNHPSIVMWSISNENPAYNAELTAGMKTGYNGKDPVNPDIQLVSADAETAEVVSDGYLGGWPGKADAYIHRDTAKTWFTYEENASYVQLDNESRRQSVIDSLRILRQQRMSLGYDAKILLAFYNFQKVFALPESASPAQPRRAAIPWTQEEINGPGYHAQYLWQSVFNPYADPPTVNDMAEYSPGSRDLWADSSSPVAVFDKGWVDGAMHDLDLATSYAPGRDLYVFNSDLSDLSTAVTVEWELVDADTGETVNAGTFTEDVPLGSYVTRHVDTGAAPTENLYLRLTASKSGTQRFTETLGFGGAGAPPPPTQSTAGGDVIVIDDGQPGTTTQGLTPTTSAYAGTYGPGAAHSTTPDGTAFARFTPHIGTTGEYTVRVHVPDGLSGSQTVKVARAEGSLEIEEVTIDLGTPGWVTVPGGPYRLQAGPANSYVELVPGGTAGALVADAVAFQRVTDGPTRLTLDQSRLPENGATWEYLGTYACQAGAGCRVTLTNEADDRVVADAVTFEKGAASIVVDEDQAAKTGAWATAAKPASVGGDVAYADPATPASATITYLPQLPEPGAYDVYATWDNNDGNQRAKRAPVIIETDPLLLPPTDWDLLDDPMSVPALWSTAGTGTVSWSDGSARLVDTSTNDFFALIRNGFVPPTDPFTYEFVARTNPSSTSGSGEVAVRSGEYYVRVVLTHGQPGTVTDDYLAPTRSHPLDTTVDHTYRVVVHADYTYDLYVDGVLAWAGAPSKGAGTDILKVGSEPATVADMTVDHVRVTTGERPPGDVVEGAARAA